MKLSTLFDGGVNLTFCHPCLLEAFESQLISSPFPFVKPPTAFEPPPLQPLHPPLSLQAWQYTPFCTGQRAIVKPVSNSSFKYNRNKHNIVLVKIE